jgi:hypothetical protein
MVRLAVFALVLAFAAGTGAAVLRADAPPAPAATPTRDVPARADCRVAAPSRAALQAAILDTPPPPTPTPGLIPTGNPAPANVAADVEATVRELVACWNAGEPLRGYGLYTDRLLARLFAKQGGFDVGTWADLATPQPKAVTADDTAIVEFGEVRMLADGRAGVEIRLAYASVPMPKLFWVELVWDEPRDHWLIDDLRGEISFSVP